MRLLKKILIILTLLTSFAANAQKIDTASIIAYIQQYKAIAIEEMNRSGIPASITLAQGIHESSFGTSYLAKNTNNHFGIKCKENWTGKTFKYTDDAPNECFRVYDKVEDSYKDHTDFLKNRPRYASLFLLDKYDYKSWATGLKQAGYATNPKYAVILIKTIEDFQLFAFDKNEMPSYIKPETISIIEGEDEEDERDYNVTDSIEIEVQKSPSETKKPEVVKTSVEIAQQKSNLPKPSGKKITKINKVNSVKLYNGETLELIGNILKVRKEDLLAFNDLKDVSQLKNGQTIFIEPKKKSNKERTYKVKSDDNIWSISQKKGVRLASLLKMNKLEDGEEPAPKEIICLKGKVKVKPKLRILKTNEKPPLENTIVRTKDTIYPTMQEPVKSTIESDKLLGWENDEKLLEQDNIKTYSTKEKRIEPFDIETDQVILQIKTPTNEIKPSINTKTHTVVKGDTLYNIYKRYNISVAQIMEWNNLSDQNIKLGQVLKIQP